MRISPTLPSVKPPSSPEKAVKDSSMSTLTPRQIVAELDKYIIGQDQAKRMVAVAVRNRWRRQRLDPALRDEIAPKNIILMGPTGVGKTEIARRLAKLTGAPFIKVEATKYTEVGYVGRDVESMIRDLLDLGIKLVRDEENERVRAEAESQAEERLLDLLLPGAGSEGSREATREKLRNLWRLGHLDNHEVEVEVKENAPQMDMFAVPGMEQFGNQMKTMMGRIMPPRATRKSMKTRAAWNILVQQASEGLIDEDRIVETAKERVEQSGIVFIDELDKIATSAAQQRSSDVSREGVQRDLLPIVEGSTVNTKYGMVRTDHILFIAAGAFHFSKPSDLIPELQGRFPCGWNSRPWARTNSTVFLPSPTTPCKSSMPPCSPPKAWICGSRPTVCRKWPPLRKTPTPAPKISARGACIPFWKKFWPIFPLKLRIARGSTSWSTATMCPPTLKT